MAKPFQFESETPVLQSTGILYSFFVCWVIDYRTTNGKHGSLVFSQAKPPIASPIAIFRDCGIALFWINN